MAATLQYFMLPEDERALFRMLARKELTLYPETFPPGTVGIPVDDRTVELLDQEAYYLAAERLGPVIVRTLARGRDRGMLRSRRFPRPSSTTSARSGTRRGSWSRAGSGRSWTSRTTPPAGRGSP